LQCSFVMASLSWDGARSWTGDTLSSGTPYLMINAIQHNLCKGIAQIHLRPSVHERAWNM
jgi:hypothetical protein